jgi:hypothetical protein
MQLSRHGKEYTDDEKIVEFGKHVSFSIMNFQPKVKDNKKCLIFRLA